MKKISKNYEWIVTYKTNSHDELYTLPAIYGIDDMYVFKTIIKKDLVTNFSYAPRVNFLQMVAIILLIVCPIVIFYYYYKQKQKKIS